MDEDTLRQEILEALRGWDVDHLEIRLDNTAATRILYRGRQLEEIGRQRSFGGNVRALYRGGWGFVSFNEAGDLRRWVELAVAHARFVGTGKSSFAEVEPVVDFVPPYLGKDPRLIPLTAKKELMDHYLDILWSVPGVTSAHIFYSDSHKRIILANAQGTYICQERIDVTLRIGASAQRNGDIQQASLSIGSLGDFSVVEGLDEQVRQLAQKAVQLLDAPYVKPGVYPVVLDPILAGVFCHEAFGHLSEADHIYENPRLRELMTIGRTFGPPILNIVDGASVPGLRGSFRYDDEGVPAQKTYLIREGVLVGRLHSRETAAKMGERPTGNARAIDYRFPPIVRMTNTYIEPGDATLDDLLSDIKEGVYACNWYGGTTSMEMFTFSAGEAYMIRNGRIAEPLRPVKLSGNVFETLMNIDAIGDDLSFNQGGGCGKGGQMPLPVSNGSPHIRIRQCLVGER